LIIDFHSHVLPGIDDGSKNTDTSVRMLEAAAEQGVDLMIATPHFYASRNTIDAFLHNRQASYDKLQAHIAEQSESMLHLPDIMLGAEVAYFDGISKAERIDELTVQGTKLLLLEMPFSAWSDATVREVEKLITERSFQVILAHLERFMGNGDNKRYISRLLDMPLTVQINAESFGAFWERRRLVRMFEEGQAHILGSDCHGIHHRVPNLSEGREALLKKCGRELLDEIDQRGAMLLGIE
jgi:protein-tyrosine phosphatase